MMAKEIQSLLPKQQAFQQIDQTLVKLYWSIGKYISEQVAQGGWGRSIVEELATFIAVNELGIKGFSARNIWTMKQFFETYQNDKKLPPLMAVVKLDSQSAHHEFENRRRTRLLHPALP
jgi:uncharacterized alpha/beta hydrolase family protein